MFLFAQGAGRFSAAPPGGNLADPWEIARIREPNRVLRSCIMPERLCFLSQCLHRTASTLHAFVGREFGNCLIPDLLRIGDQLFESIAGIIGFGTDQSFQSPPKRHSRIDAFRRKIAPEMSKIGFADAFLDEPVEHLGKKIVDRSLELGCSDN
jgi:hypothetical protein